MSRNFALAITAFVCLAGLAAAPAPPEGPAVPETPRRPVTDTYSGTSVTDDYRWLENGADREVVAWSEAQNARARAVLDVLPHVAEIRERAREIAGFASASYASLEKRGPWLFAIKTLPPRQQPFLVAMASADSPSSERVVVDPNAIDTKGSTSIDFYVPSLDGQLVAVSLSKGGSEAGSIHIYETATGRKRPDVIPRVNGGTAGGDIAWSPDGSGFIYTRYPRSGERPPRDLDFYQEVYDHRLGTASDRDTYVFGREFPKIAETTFETSSDRKRLLAVVKNGDGGDASLYLGGPTGTPWKKIAGDADLALAGRFAPDGSLYLLSRKGSGRGSILRLKPGAADLSAAAVAVPESEIAIDDFRVTANRIFVADLAGGYSQLRVLDFNGRVVSKATLPPACAIAQIAAAGDDSLLFSLETMLEPPSWKRAGPDGKISATALTGSSPVDFRDAEVVREWAVSKDGTRVPIDVLRKKGTRLDGNNPTLLYGYGGYAVSQRPTYSAMRRIWIAQGGVWAVAAIRGGGEFGDGWHRSGRLTTKQNVFDDFAACAERLIALGYTRPSRLAIEGGSNGGLLMGAMLTQHPDRFRAVVGHVGIYDMLRVELSPNGEFNVTEFGTVGDPAQFRALYAYSPYHHVKDGVAYPDILFLTGANDPRVDPMQSRKMTARLQAASSGKPVLLRTSNASGHGIGSSLDEKVGESVDVYAFLFDRLGVDYRPAK
jgi:prolyl oligopeptidase